MYDCLPYDTDPPLYCELISVCDDAGAAYVYKTYDSGETWEEKAKLLASDGAASDAFGWSVAVHNDTIVVGAFWDNNNGGTNAGDGQGQRVYRSLTVTCQMLAQCLCL